MSKILDFASWIKNNMNCCPLSLVRIIEDLYFKEIAASV
jgi:hypothetical protein